MLNLLLFIGMYLSSFINTFLLHPAWAFILYQLTYFFYPNNRWWGSSLPDISYSFLAVILMAVAYLKDIKNHNTNKLLAIPQFKWAILLGLSYIAAYFYSALPDAHSEATIYFIKLLIVMAIAYKLIDSPKKLNDCLLAYIYGSAYIGFIVFQTGRNRGDRVEGVGTIDAPESNTIAATIAPAAIIALYYLWVNTAAKSRFTMLFLGAFIANALVLINSRGAMIATAVGTFYFMYHLYFSKFQRKNQKLSVILLLIFGLVGAATIIDESTINRLSTLTTQDTNEEAENGATRIFFWKAAIEMSKDYPLGLGYKGFNTKAPEYIPDEIDTGGSRYRSVHSTWFQALSEVGYPGTFALLMMLIYSFITTQRCKSSLSSQGNIDDYFKIIAIQSALLTYLVSITFINRLTAEVFFWFILFTACAYNIYVLKLTVPDTQNQLT